MLLLDCLKVWLLKSRLRKMSAFLRCWYVCAVVIATIRSIAIHRLLTHWSRVMHICVFKLTIIGSDNGLSSGLRQAIIWTNAGILLIGSLGTNFSDIFTWATAHCRFSLNIMHTVFLFSQTTHWTISIVNRKGWRLYNYVILRDTWHE